MTRDYGIEAQRAAEAHLEQCERALYVEDFKNPDDSQWPAAMGGPFCGCTTCMVREVLFAAWPILQEAAVEEYEELRRHG